MQGSPPDQAVQLDDEVQALLRERANRYARSERTTRQATTEVVTFRRGPGRYAIALGALREIRALRGLCAIPGASPVIPGMFHYRGELMSAHDLEAYLTACDRRPDAVWVLVVEQGDKRIGLLADEVSSVEALSDGDRLPLPVTLGDRKACFSAVVGDGVLLVEPSALFTTPAFFRAF